MVRFSAKQLENIVGKGENVACYGIYQSIARRKIKYDSSTGMIWLLKLGNVC